MANGVTPEVINGGTQLERALAAVRPRLYLTAESLAELKQRVGAPPAAVTFARVLRAADAAVANPCPEAAPGGLDRGHGCSLPNLALAFLLTQDAKYLAAARQYLRAAAGYPTWTSSLLYGHVSFGVSVAYDWLHDQLDDETRALVQQALAARAREVAIELGTHQGWASGAYTCNHYPVIMTGLLAAGATLYGEVPGTAPLLRMSLEKFRLMRDALGPDGASQEGLGYGEYYAEYLLKGLTLVRDLLNQDLFAASDWLKNTPLFYLYSTLPRKSWKATDCVVHFGDGVRHHWYGPDVQLRRLAAEYRDPLAQGLAAEVEAAGVATDSAACFSLLWCDPSVPTSGPASLPPLHHFADKDVVFLRSGWDGTESVSFFKCGPCFGYHALEHYRHDIGGGHMAPDAGSFQIFACGDHLIVDDEYCQKFTSQQNTLLINGRGQTGEGGDWFESTELRLDERAPTILRVESLATHDYVLGNVAPAYERTTGLRKFLRHFIFIKPATWILMDEVEAAEAATFELCFHSDFPFRQISEGEYSVNGPSGALILNVMQPDNIMCNAFRQPLKVQEGRGPAELEALTVANAEKTDKVVFLIVLQAHPSDQAQPEAPNLTHGRLILHAEKGPLIFQLSPGRKDLSQPGLTVG